MKRAVEGSSQTLRAGKGELKTSRFLKVCNEELICGFLFGLDTLAHDSPTAASLSALAQQWSHLKSLSTWEKTQKQKKKESHGLSFLKEQKIVLEICFCAGVSLL